MNLFLVSGLVPKSSGKMAANGENGGRFTGRTAAHKTITYSFLVMSSSSKESLKEIQSKQDLILPLVNMNELLAYLMVSRIELAE